MSKSVCLNPVLTHASGDYNVKDSAGHNAGRLGLRHYKESNKEYMLIGGNSGGKQPNSALQIAARNTFKSVATQVAAIMKDPSQLSTYKEEWQKAKPKADTKAKTLRGYIFGEVYKEVKV